MVRRTEQHIRLYDTPPRRIRTSIEFFGPPERTANGWTHSIMIRPQRRPETRNTTNGYGTTPRWRKKRGLENTTTDRWQNRNLRPTPPRIDGHGENPRLTPPPTTSPQRSPDSELRRSSHILARKSLSDTD